MSFEMAQSEGPYQIVGRIVGPVLTITLFAAGVAYAKDNGFEMFQTSSIVPLLSVVVSFWVSPTSRSLVIASSL